MARLASIATGNLTASSTWGVIGFIRSVTASTAVDILTTTYSGTRGQLFTPGAMTISHIAVFLGARTGTTGTLSVHIADSSNVEVPGTLCTINTADLPPTDSGHNGWIMLKFAAPVSLLAATSYKIEALTSSSTQVNLYRGSATVDDLAFFLVTTTTQAPVAGDDLYIQGEYTGAGTSNSFTVTMNSTATTDYGSNSSTDEFSSGIQVSSKGTLQYGVAASTDYYLRISGFLTVLNNGTFTMGTVANPCPRTSTMSLNFDCTTDGQFGFFIKNSSVISIQGQSRTVGKDVSHCKLTSDAAVNATTLNVDTDTGWLDNDLIAIAPTGKVNGYLEYESGSLNGAAGASSLTVDGFAGAGGGLAYAHQGSSPIFASVVNLTRNVKIFGASVSLRAYIDVQAGYGYSVDIDWCEFYWLGISSSKGIMMISVQNSVVGISIQYCSFHNNAGIPPTTTSYIWGVRILMASANYNTPVVFSNNVMYHLRAYAMLYVGSLTGSPNAITTDEVFDISISLNVFISNYSTSGSGYFAYIGMPVTEFTNNILAGQGTVSGTYALSITVADRPCPLSNFSGNVIYTSRDAGLHIDNSLGIRIDGIEIYRCVNGVYAANPNAIDYTLINASIKGCANGIYIGTGAATLKNLRFENITIDGESGATFTRGIYFAPGDRSVLDIEFVNVTVGASYTPSLGHIVSSTTYCIYEIRFIKCTLTIPVASAIIPSMIYAVYGYMSFIHCNGGTDITTYKSTGTIFREITTVRTGTYSLKMSPYSASRKLTTNAFYAPVQNGNTLTPSVYVREDVSYNGNRARLIVKANDLLGITEDTVLDTATVASDGAWEQLTGTTAAVTADGILEFIVDCDGTAGSLFVDDFTV